MNLQWRFSKLEWIWCCSYSFCIFFFINSVLNFGFIKLNGLTSTFSLIKQGRRTSYTKSKKKINYLHLFVLYTHFFYYIFDFQFIFFFVILFNYCNVFYWHWSVFVFAINLISLLKWISGCPWVVLSIIFRWSDLLVSASLL